MVIKNTTKLLDEQNIMGANQHSFSKEKSCLSVFFKFVINMVIKEEPADIIYLDFLKSLWQSSLEESIKKTS